MRLFNRFIHPLTLLSLLAVVINKSWAVDVKTSENSLRNVLQNFVHPVPPKYSRIFTHVDQRIGDIIAENVLHFGHNLGLELAALDPLATKSEIFSPLSIMAALSLLMVGAKGRSYQELKQLLALDSDSELIKNPSKYHEQFGLMLNDLQYSNINSVGGTKRPNANWRHTKLKTAPVRTTSRNNSPVEHIIKVANGLFVQNGYTLNPDYSRVLQSIYETEFSQLDFSARNIEARDYINNWVNKATFGKIPQVINGEIEKSTNIILASALYFKAFWETSFFFRATTEDYFYPDGVHNPPIKVQMMPTGGVFPFYDAKEYNCRIIGLPYKGNETTMYVIQPKNSTRQRLRELQHVLTAHKINGMIDNMERKTTVMVFPKMHFTRSMNMKKILRSMDIHDIFINGYSDLSLIGGKPQSSYAPSTQESPPFTPSPSLVQSGGNSAQFAPGKISTEYAPVSFESIYRENPAPQLYDTYAGTPYILDARIGEIEESDNNTKTVNKNNTTDAKAMLSTNKREKRQALDIRGDPALLALSNLEADRLKPDPYRADLFVDDIIHKVDFSVDEQGTEAAAATLTYLHRSGTDVVFRGDTPFLIVIRHDPTKLPLFYGIINKPEL